MARTADASAAVEEGTSIGEFSSVAALGPHGEDAARKLRAVHERLRDLGAAGDAERLVAMERAAERRDFVTLERLAATQHSLDELSELRHRNVRRVTAVRNSVALLPLLVTWFLLGWASLSYQHQINANRKLVGEPFLALWQGRFGGESIPTFTETALTTVVLIVTILFLTMWAHRLESAANRVVQAVTTQVDEAVDAFAVAAETSTVRPPISAQDWAETAQRVLTQTHATLLATQEMIKAAVSETKELAEENRRVFEEGRKGMVEVQAQASDLVTGLAREVQETLVAVREDNAQFITRTAEEALQVLQQAATDNRQLVERHMTPLFEGFRESLKEYRADQKTYHDSAAELAGSVTELTKSAAVLAGSSKSYTEVATSIDRHLELIEKSQSEFTARVAEHSTGIETAATSLREVTDLLGVRMRADLEALSRNVVTAGTRIAEVDDSLAKTSATLQTTTRALRDAATKLAGAARWRGGLWGLFRRGGGT